MADSIVRQVEDLHGRMFNGFSVEVLSLIHI